MKRFGSFSNTNTNSTGKNVSALGSAGKSGGFGGLGSLGNIGNIVEMISMLSKLDLGSLGNIFGKKSQNNAPPERQQASPSNQMAQHPNQTPPPERQQAPAPNQGQHLNKAGAPERQDTVWFPESPPNYADFYQAESPQHTGPPHTPQARQMSRQPSPQTAPGNTNAPIPSGHPPHDSSQPVFTYAQPNSNLENFEALQQRLQSERNRHLLLQQMEDHQDRVFKLTHKN